MSAGKGGSTTTREALLSWLRLWMVSDLEPELLLLVPPERPWLGSGFAFETEADAVADAMALDPLRDP